MPLPVDVGDGRHGTFEPSTYARFSVGGTFEQHYTFQYGRISILQVTSFHLAPGWRIEPVGDSPLLFIVLSDIIIEGEIWCQGHDGGDAVNATRGLGGEGRCGGKRGGDGGTATGNGSNGEQASAFVLGGYGGQVALPAVGGGGPGSWNATSAPGNGPNFSAGNGQAGTNDSDPEFLQLIGGAGGGGGGGSGTNAGAGGGGGGGLVILHAVHDFILGTAPTSMTGFIYASGGRGGVSNANGGAGGGGGGGGVKVFVGGSIEIYNEDVVARVWPTTEQLRRCRRQRAQLVFSVDYNLSGNGTHAVGRSSPQRATLSSRAGAACCEHYI